MTKDQAKPLWKSTTEDFNGNKVPAVVSSDGVETRYGWGRVRPRFLQWMNKPQWFVVWLALFSFFQSLSVNGMTGLTFPSLEKRFQFSSKQAGLIAASNDVSGIIMVAFASFCGGYGNKIKWLGYGALVTGFGSLVYVLPHLIAGPYNPPSKLILHAITETCSAGNQTSALGSVDGCAETENYNMLYLLLFITSQLIMGAGTAPLYSLGPAYLDENVHPKSMPMYLAVWYFTFVMGPALGFVAGGFILNVYVDLKQPEGLNLTPRDPRWIGAWWLGFFIAGVSLVFVFVILIGFPTEMPGSRAMREQAIKEGIIPDKDDEVKASVKDLPRATKLLLANKTYVCTTLGQTIGMLFTLGIGPFFTKILIMKFGITQATAGMSLGATIFPGMALGIIGGGLIVRKLNLKDSTKKAALACALMQLVGITGGVVMLIPGCNDIEITGLATPYQNSTTVLPYPGSEGQLDYLLDTCNADCGCSESQYSPVCGSDHRTYYGACQAGCKTKLSETVYSNCSCIPAYGNSSSSSSPMLGTATRGICDRNCKNYKLFLGAIFVMIAISAISAIPQKTVSLRCVPDNLRAYGLGIQIIFNRTLGALPGPILFGSVMDSYCTLWSADCGSNGNCFAYDIGKLTEMMATVGCLVQAIACVFFFLAWYFYKKPVDPLEEKEKHITEKQVLMSKETVV